MENIKRVFNLMGRYLKFFIYIFFGYALFRTVLFQFASELNNFFFVLDIFIYWLICVSLIVRFNEIDRSDSDTTWIRGLKSLFHVIIMWAINGFLFVGATWVFVTEVMPLLPDFNEEILFVAKMIINALVGFITVLGTFYILDFKLNFWSAYGRVVRFLYKNIPGSLLMLCLYCGTAFIGQALFGQSRFLEFLKGGEYFDAGAFFAVYSITFLTLVIYGAFYWVYRPEKFQTPVAFD